MRSNTSASVGESTVPISARHPEEFQHGGRTIPTIVFPDDSHLLEPSNAELADKLGLQLRATRRIYDVLILGGGPGRYAGPRLT